MTQEQIRQSVARHEKLSRKHRDEVRVIQRLCHHPSGYWSEIQEDSAFYGGENFYCPDCHKVDTRRLTLDN